MQTEFRGPILELRSQVVKEGRYAAAVPDAKLLDPVPVKDARKPTRAHVNVCKAQDFDVQRRVGAKWSNMAEQCLSEDIIFQSRPSK